MFAFVIIMLTCYVHILQSNMGHEHCMKVMKTRNITFRLFIVVCCRCPNLGLTVQTCSNLSEESPGFGFTCDIAKVKADGSRKYGQGQSRRISVLWPGSKQTDPGIVARGIADGSCQCGQGQSRRIPVLWPRS